MNELLANQKKPSKSYFSAKMLDIFIKNEITILNNNLKLFKRMRFLNNISLLNFI